jgi:hypothetical protein
MNVPHATGLQVHTRVTMKNVIFWYATPCSLVKVNRRFGQTYSFHRYAISCFAHSSTLKMEVIYSSEKSIDFHRTPLRYIPEEGTLRIVCRLILRMAKPDILFFPR